MLEELRSRLLALVFCFIVLVACFAVGSFTPAPEGYVDQLRNMRRWLGKEREEGVWTLTKSIFLNNVLVSAVGFVPIFGLFWLLFIHYNTGLWLSALASDANNGGDFVLTRIYLLVFLFIHPHTWLEFLAYSIAFTQNAYLSYALLFKRKISAVKKELKYSVLSALAYASLLFVGAFVESLFIVLGI